jgi:hypothetical protein
VPGLAPAPQRTQRPAAGVSGAARGDGLEPVHAQAADGPVHLKVMILISPGRSEGNRLQGRQTQYTTR